MGGKSKKQAKNLTGKWRKNETEHSMEEKYHCKTGEISRNTEAGLASLAIPAQLRVYQLTFARYSNGANNEQIDFRDLVSGQRLTEGKHSLASDSCSQNGRRHFVTRRRCRELDLQQRMGVTATGRHNHSLILILKKGSFFFLPSFA